MLTHAQKECLDFIVVYTRNNLESPSLEDICAGLGYAHKSAVHYMLRRLQERGHIAVDDRKARSIKVIHRAPRVQYFRFDDETKGFVPWPPLRKASGQG